MAVTGRGIQPGVGGVWKMGPELGALSIEMGAGVCTHRVGRYNTHFVPAVTRQLIVLYSHACGMIGIKHRNYEKTFGV